MLYVYALVYTYDRSALSPASPRPNLSTPYYEPQPTTLPPTSYSIPIHPSYEPYSTPSGTSLKQNPIPPEAIHPSQTSPHSKSTSLFPPQSIFRSLSSRKAILTSPQMALKTHLTPILTPETPFSSSLTFYLLRYLPRTCHPFSPSTHLRHR